MSETPAAPPTDETSEEDIRERRYRAPALEKGLDVLELLAAHGAAMTPSQISVALDRSVSELFRMIQVLEYRGYIAPATSGDGYELSNKLFTLGMARAPVKTLLETALPVMRELSQAIRQSCHLGVVSDEQMVVVARVESPGYLGLSLRPGYRRDLPKSTSGAVIFAFQPPEVQAQWLERLAPGTPAPQLKAFVARAAAIRARGYECLQSDFVEGMTDLSAPLICGGVAVAALATPFVQLHPPPVTVEDSLEQLLQAAARISKELNASL